MLTKKDFNGPEFQSWAVQQYEEIRVKANSRGKFKPDQYDRIELSLDKLFERFYRAITTDQKTEVKENGSRNY